VVVRRIEIRSCDQSDCTAEAVRVSLSIEDGRWDVDLCDVHRQQVMASAPWRAYTPSKINAYLDHRVRMPEPPPVSHPDILPD
jgi:hypothetical protein